MTDEDAVAKAVANSRVLSILKQHADRLGDGAASARVMVGLTVLHEIQREVCNLPIDFSKCESVPVDETRDDGYQGTVFHMPVYYDHENPARFEVEGQ